MILTGGASHRPLRTVLVVLLLVIGGGIVAVGPVAAAQQAQVSDVTVDPTEPAAGEPVTVTVTVSNLASSDGAITVESVRLRDAATGDLLTQTAEIGQIDPGGSLDIPVVITLVEAGLTRIQAEAYVENVDRPLGRDRYIQPVVIDVAEPLVRPDLTVSPGSAYGTTDLTLANYGTLPLEAPQLTVTGPDGSPQTYYLQDVAPGANRTRTIDTRGWPMQSLRVTATYTAADATDRLTVDHALAERATEPGQVRLTSVDAVRTAGGIELTGDAANLGELPVEAVYLRVGETAEVTPIPPRADFFVGEVAASEFATFRLTANVAPNTSAVPIEIRYIMANAETVTTQTVPVDPGVTAPTEDDGGGGVPWLAVLIALVVAAAAALVYRSRS
jgi:hypothetical protein